MAERKRIPMEEYSIVISNPTNRLSMICVNIYKDGRFNMNGKLAEKLGGKKISIRFTKDARHFAMIESEDTNAIPFPKNGYKKLEEISKLLTIHKVSLPAQFEVWYDEEMHAWLGELAENPTILQSGKPHSSKKK